MNPVELLWWHYPKMSADHLELLAVFGKKENRSKVFKSIKSFTISVLTYIHSYFSSFSVILIHKSLNLVIRVWDYMMLQHFDGNLIHRVLYLYILPTLVLNLRDQPRRCTYFGAELAFVAGMVLLKDRWG